MKCPRGRSRSIPFRLCSRAPRMMMASLTPKYPLTKDQGFALEKIPFWKLTYEDPIFIFAPTCFSVNAQIKGAESATGAGRDLVLNRFASGREGGWRRAAGSASRRRRGRGRRPGDLSGWCRPGCDSPRPGSGRPCALLGLRRKWRSRPYADPAPVGPEVNRDSNDPDPTASERPAFRPRPLLREYRWVSVPGLQFLMCFWRRSAGDLRGQGVPRPWWVPPPRSPGRSA